MWVFIKAIVCKSVPKPSGPSNCSHSMRQLGVSPLPPGWDASPLQSYPPISSGFPENLLVPIYTLSGEKHCESREFCPKTQHNDPARSWIWPLYLESGAPTIRPTCLPPLLIKCTCVISFVVISIVCSSSTLSSRVGLFRWRSWRVASSCTDGNNKRLYSQDISQANWTWQN